MSIHLLWVERLKAGQINRINMLHEILTLITVSIVALVVLILVLYLILIIIALWKAGTYLQQLAGGLQKIADDTKPLSDRLGTINGALGQLRDRKSVV